MKITNQPKHAKTITLSVICFFLNTFLYLNANPNYFKAMQDEIDRTLSQLHFETQQKPYFIEYTLEIRSNFGTSATLGQIISKNISTEAILNVSVRVGNYKFDNTNY